MIIKFWQIFLSECEILAEKKVHFTQVNFYYLLARNLVIFQKLFIHIGVKLSFVVHINLCRFCSFFAFHHLFSFGLHRFFIFFIGFRRKVIVFSGFVYFFQKLWAVCTYNFVCFIKLLVKRFHI